MLGHTLLYLRMRSLRKNNATSLLSPGLLLTLLTLLMRSTGTLSLLPQLNDKARSGNAKRPRGSAKIQTSLKGSTLGFAPRRSQRVTHGELGTDCGHHDGAAKPARIPSAPGTLTLGGTAVRLAVSSVTRLTLTRKHVVRDRMTVIALISCLSSACGTQDTVLGTRSFAKRQILRYDHGYAVESLPTPATAVALHAAAREPTARAPALEDEAKPSHETDHSVPRWVANDRKVRDIAWLL